MGRGGGDGWGGWGGGGGGVVGEGSAGRGRRDTPEEGSGVRRRQEGRQELCSRGIQRGTQQQLQQQHQDQDGAPDRQDARYSSHTHPPTKTTLMSLNCEPSLVVTTPST